MISLPENAKVLKPEKLSESASLLVSLTSAGRMLIFPVRDLPALSKGKGNKIISIPKERNAKARSELLKLFLISEQASLEFHSGKRKITFKTGRSAKNSERNAAERAPNHVDYIVMLTLWWLNLNTTHKNSRNQTK